MKKIWLLAGLAVLLCGMVTACGKEETAAEVDLTALYGQVAELCGWKAEDMMDLDSEMLDLYYSGLTDLSFRQEIAKVPVVSYDVAELVLVECESEEDAAKAGEIFQGRIDAQAGGDAWYPETVDQWKAARVTVQGRYAALVAAGAHQQEAEETVTAAFAA